MDGNQQATQLLLAYFHKFTYELNVCIKRTQDRDIIIAELSANFPDLHAEGLSGQVDRTLKELTKRKRAKAIKQILRGVF